jgi:hypothetical protein
MSGNIDPQRLSIDSVINGTCGETADILYAEFISTSATEKLISNYTETFDVNTKINDTNTLIEDINTILKATNSSRFSTGVEATANINNINDISSNLTLLKDNVDKIYGDLITAIAKTYNDKLETLKKDVRIKLLRDAADVWNSEKHVASESDYTCTVDNPPVNETAIFDSSVVYTEYIYQGYDEKTYNLKYKKYKYKIIKYWEGLKNLHWFKDPGFEKVEQLFEEVGCSLPYEPSAIVDPEGDYSSKY